MKVNICLEKSRILPFFEEIISHSSALKNLVLQQPAFKKRCEFGWFLEKQCIYAVAVSWGGEVVFMLITQSSIVK